MAAKQITTTCVMDCPDTCELSVSVENGRVTSIKGGRHHPDTAGFICQKVSQFHQRLYHKDRILNPLQRVGEKGGGQWKEISWNEALKTITTRFRQIKKKWGGEAIVPYHYGGSNGLLADEFLDDLYFARLGASRLDKTVCAAPSSAVFTGMYGKMPGVAFKDYIDAECIIIWGGNPKVSNIHLLPYLKKAKKRGAFVAVVDPFKTMSAREADLHLSIYPGTDLALALALIHIWAGKGQLDDEFIATHTHNSQVLLDAAQKWTPERASKVTGIPADDMQRLASIYGSASPAVVRVGWGTERNRNGGQALAAIGAIPALMGKFGVRGGGYSMSNSGATRFESKNILGDIPWETRMLNMTQLGRQLLGKLDPPIKGMFVYNCNPVATVPQQDDLIRGLKDEDLFTVVHEHVMTDTARLADIVLPATTFLEQFEIKQSYGSLVVGAVNPAVNPLGRARPNHWLFAELGKEMGFDDAAFYLEEGELLEAATAAIRANNKSLKQHKFWQNGFEDIEFPEEGPIQFKTVFPATDDGKIECAPLQLGANPYGFKAFDDARWPLAMISPASSKLTNSTFGEFNLDELTVSLHPADAMHRGLKNKDDVRVFNDLGEVHCRLNVTDRIREGVVLMPKGAWMKSSRNGRTSVALVSDEINEVAGGACYNDARVEVAGLVNDTALPKASGDVQPKAR